MDPKMSRRIFQAVFAGFALATLMTPVSSLRAATVTTTLPVSLTVTAGCSVQATGINFGSTSGATNVTSTGTITVTCLSGTSYTVTLDGGIHSSIANLRTLQSSAVGTTSIVYELYKDAATTQIWGDNGFGNTYMQGTGVGGTGTGVGQPLTVFGKILNTGNSAGTFTDTVVVTVNF